MTSSQWSNAIGLICDIIGVVMLFKYGLPAEVNQHGHSFLIGEQDDEEEKIKWKKYNFLSKIALGFLLLGFVLQFIAVILGSNNNNYSRNEFHSCHCYHHHCK